MAGNGTAVGTFIFGLQKAKAARVVVLGGCMYVDSTTGSCCKRQTKERLEPPMRLPLQGDQYLKIKERTMYVHTIGTLQ